MNRSERSFAQYGVNVTIRHADESSVEEFRRQAAENLARKGDFIIVNYLRTSVGQEGGTSPL